MGDTSLPGPTSADLSPNRSQSPTETTISHHPPRAVGNPSLADKVVGTAQVLHGRATGNVNEEFVGELRRVESKSAVVGLEKGKEAGTARDHGSSLAR